VNQPSSARAAISVGTVTLIALILRLIAQNQLRTHVDEPASLLAVAMISETGMPTFPSGVLYLQGAVLSYLGAPLARLYAGYDLLEAVRVINIGFSVLVVPITMKIVLHITRNLPAATLTGILVCCDPNLMLWGVLIRPYGLLTVMTVALAYIVIVLLTEGVNAHVGPIRAIYWVPVLSALGTFTHIGFWLAFPAVALMSVAVWQAPIQGALRVFARCGPLAILPLAVFLILGRTAGIGSGTGSGALGARWWVATCLQSIA